MLVYAANEEYMATKNAEFLRVSHGRNLPQRM